MSKQLVDRKEQGGMIARMNGLVIGISDTSYTVSSQSGSRNLGDQRMKHITRIAILKKSCKLKD
jgi:hypothetical protein